LSHTGFGTLLSSYSLQVVDLAIVGLGLLPSRWQGAQLALQLDGADDVVGSLLLMHCLHGHGDVLRHAGVHGVQIDLAGAGRGTAWELLGTVLGESGPSGLLLAARIGIRIVGCCVAPGAHIKVLLQRGGAAAGTGVMYRQAAVLRRWLDLERWDGGDGRLAIWLLDDLGRLVADADIRLGARVVGGVRTVGPRVRGRRGREEGVGQLPHAQGQLQRALGVTRIQDAVEQRLEIVVRVLVDPHHQIVGLDRRQHVLVVDLLLDQAVCIAVAAG